MSATCAFIEPQQIHQGEERMMGNRLQTWSRIRARAGLECDRQARLCIKISEQECKILIPTVLVNTGLLSDGGGQGAGERVIRGGAT